MKGVLASRLKKALGMSSITQVIEYSRENYDKYRPLYKKLWSAVKKMSKTDVEREYEVIRKERTKKHAWHNFVRKFRREHPTIPGNHLFKKASQAYRGGSVNYDSDSSGASSAKKKPAAKPKKPATKPKKPAAKPKTTKTSAPKTRTSSRTKKTTKK